jgi:hypothetical protein
MIPALVAVLRGYEESLVRLPADDVLTARGPASFDHLVDGESFTSDQPVVEYLDPPYAGSTKYPNGHLGRANVVALARVARARGAAVIVSEREPISDLVRDGWTAEALREGASSGDSPFKSQGDEWITYISG